MNVKRKRTSLLDIAQEAGVSTSTASRILNNQDRSDPQTRAHVLKTAERLGYTLPKDVKRRDGNKAVAAIMGWEHGSASTKSPVSVYGSFDHIQRALISIEQTCQMHGYHLILNSASGTSEVLPSSIQTGVVEGALLLGGQFADPFVARIAQEVPTVFVGSYLAQGGVHAIHCNYTQGAAQAVDHLVELGHRRIALLNGSHRTHSSADKLAGFLRSCHSYDLPVDRSLIVHADGFQMAYGLAAAQDLFKQAQFTALIGATDGLSAAAIEVAQARGLRVPDDLSVVSLYNANAGAPFQAGIRSLSGVQVPHELIGQLAAERLLAILAQPIMPAEIVLPVEFEIGDTSGPAPPA
jgi:DNA-binding LacI/PurR family transcriptional regulator